MHGRSYSNPRSMNMIEYSYIEFNTGYGILADLLRKVLCAFLQLGAMKPQSHNALSSIPYIKLEFQGQR